jgi:RNA polymerase sigma factor (sigma-70 family)
MRAIRDGDPDAGLVVAAQRGDRAALDALVAQYLPLLYNIVGRALNGHADTDDVVQETMLRAVRGIGDLRDPAAFRSWLVAVAVRQVRDHAASRRTHLTGDDPPDVADPGADFVDLTILRMGLSGQRRETAEATRWLDDDDQELLALWWQEAAGTLDRGEVAAGLGMTPAHAAVRISRMKERLTTARLVVRALRARPRCGALAEMTAGWDESPSPLWRKRVARHARDCPACGPLLADLIPAEHLLSGAPLLPLPVALASAARIPIARPPAAHHGAMRAHGAAARHLRVLPKAVASLQPKVAVAVIAATACVAGGAVAVARAAAARPVPVRAVAAPRPARSAPPPALRTVPPTPPPAPSYPPVSHPAAPPPPPPPAAGLAKGVGAWSFSGVTAALAQSRASWYYTWATSPDGITSPPGTAFVPMIWGQASVTSAALAQVRQEGRYLLTFNEPDSGSQANMTVAQALADWPALEATGMLLGSPAVQDDAATPGSWLDQFMSGARARGYRVDFITVHWYAQGFDPVASVSELQSYLESIYQRYHLPIWVTEFGMVHFGSPTTYPTDSEQSAFLTGAAAMFASLGYVQRYAWFALPVSSGDGNMGLFASGPAVTPEGRAFETAAGR